MTPKTVEDESVKLIQFKVTNKVFKELLKTKKDTGSLSISELIRDSIKLYQWAIDMKKEGYTLYSIPDSGDGNKFKIVLPIPQIKN